MQNPCERSSHWVSLPSYSLLYYYSTPIAPSHKLDHPYPRDRTVYPWEFIQWLEQWGPDSEWCLRDFLWYQLYTITILQATHLQLRDTLNFSPRFHWPWEEKQRVNKQKMTFMSETSKHKKINRPPSASH